ncbi:hypothetical protein DFH07DRAFT_763680 [Mycena maculata]|uniref:Uncharacterized protein n=1 Tax=Mycena maculata TaxID=230809 RepID=A0AAD7KGE6_9AGAR|nr:hypothetical protein DFH07DRAFT_763680 [Mycena maculata]
MFNLKFFIFFATAANLLTSAAGQNWEIQVYEASAGGTSSCTGGGTTIASSDTNECHVVGLGSNEVGFNVLVDEGLSGAEYVLTARMRSNSWDRVPVSLVLLLSVTEQREKPGSTESPSLPFIGYYPLKLRDVHVAFKFDVLALLAGTVPDHVLG